MTRKLTDQEKKLWQAIAQTIKKLELTVDVKTEKQSEPAKKTKRRSQDTQIAKQPTVSSAISPPCKSQSRVRKVNVEATIDLHGDTRAEAEPRLYHFLERAQQQGKVWVLVITGKGSISQEGVLKRSVPEWLNSWPFVSGFTPAKIKDGGAGALYVRLKKLR